MPENGHDAPRIDTGLGWHVVVNRHPGGASYTAVGTHPPGTRLGRNDISGKQWAVQLDALAAQLVVALSEARSSTPLAASTREAAAGCTHFHLATMDGETWTLEWRRDGGDLRQVEGGSPAETLAAMRAWERAAALGLAPTPRVAGGWLRLRVQGDQWALADSDTSWQGGIPLHELVDVGRGAEVLIRVVVCGPVGVDEG